MLVTTPAPSSTLSDDDVTTPGATIADDDVTTTGTTVMDREVTEVATVEEKPTESVTEANPTEVNPNWPRHDEHDAEHLKSTKIAG